MNSSVTLTTPLFYIVHGICFFHLVKNAAFLVSLGTKLVLCLVNQILNSALHLVFIVKFDVLCWQETQDSILHIILLNFMADMAKFGSHLLFFVDSVDILPIFLETSFVLLQLFFLLSIASIFGDLTQSPPEAKVQEEDRRFKVIRLEY